MGGCMVCTAHRGVFLLGRAAVPAGAGGLTIVLTISQLAAYSGVTVRAVRHYHQIGLLPEPARDVSGYRRYDAAAVVRLIRIRTLAEAGVPLGRVQELLEADPAVFAEAVAQLDADLREDIRRLQRNRQRISRLAAGDSLSLPQVVVDYLDRLRGIGAPEAAVVAERDAWILVAARWPERIGDFMVDKNRQLDDERVVRFYRLMGDLLDEEAPEAALATAADLLIELFEEADRSGGEVWEEVIGDDGFVSLMDAFARQSHPLVERLQRILADRGWTGWTRMERTSR